MLVLLTFDRLTSDQIWLTWGPLNGHPEYIGDVKIASSTSNRFIWVDVYFDLNISYCFNSSSQGSSRVYQKPVIECQCEPWILLLLLLYFYPSLPQTSLRRLVYQWPTTWKLVHKYQVLELVTHIIVSFIKMCVYVALRYQHEASRARLALWLLTVFIQVNLVKRPHPISLEPLWKQFIYVY